MAPDISMQVLILDFDGVIVESNDIKDRVFQIIFGRYPTVYDALLAYHRKHVSVSRYQKFDFLLEKIGKQNDVVLKEQLLADFSNLTLDIMRSVPFVKGAKDFLNEIHSQFPTYLASVTPIADLEIILAELGIRSFFKNVYGCPPWTKPNAIRDILQKENCLPQNAVLVGDSYGDQRAATETGVVFIGRNSGLLFDDPQPERVIPDLINASRLFKNKTT